MNFTQTIQIPPTVMSRAVGDESVLLDLSNGTYFGLNPVGTRIWGLLSQGVELQQIVEIMAEEFDVARDQLEKDLEDLLQTLRSHKLLLP